MFRIICIISFGALIHYSLAAIENISDRTGCYHNGTLFANGSLVPTTEPCLNCKCTVNTLICSLRVCAEMPVPPPRGCVLVHKKNGCCPFLSCSKYHTAYDGPNRRIVAYLDHYERETIDRMVNDNVLQRRSDDSELDGTGDICILNGTVYKSGSAMTTSSLCSYCYCIGGVQKCVKPKCMLNMDGCKPIFVDSTCCPVRYDCTSKNSGIVKAPRIHIRRSGNKHYLRTAGRLQRNRGCIINSTYYPEGQKLPTDPEKHCDICFCIRGSRKCAPKKCAPALKNCIPVVPKGQCCPSSYDCNNTREPGRQFDLFSLLFGADQGKNSTSTSIATTEYESDPLIRTSTEKSFFDAIREGLEFIDGNESTVGDVLKNLNLVNETTTSTTQAPTSESSIQLKEDNFSFLDILLGKDNRDTTEGIDHKAGTISNADTSTTNEELLSTEDPTSTMDYSSEDEEESIYSSTYEAEDTTVLDEEYSSTTDSWAENSSLEEEVSTESTSTLVYTSTEIEGKENLADILLTTSTPNENATLVVSTVDAENEATSSKPEHKEESTESEGDFFSALFSGLTSILEPTDNKTEKVSKNFTELSITTTVVTVTELTPTTILSITTFNTANSSSENQVSTTEPAASTIEMAASTMELITSTTESAASTTTEGSAKLLTPQPSEKPMVIKTNPSILEADYNFDYNEPTLPPSLPNLKIIPFLPADAVKSDRKHISFDYYKHKPTAYPSITEKHDNWGQVSTVSKSSIPKIDYDVVYDHTSYPSITENYENPSSFENSGEHKKYSFSSFDYSETDEKYLDENKFEKPPKYEEPAKGYENLPTYDKFVKTEAPSFDLNVNRFSPPTKTEGGFVPKDTLKDNFYFENFHTTKFLIDLTTAVPKVVAQNTTKAIIGIATPDPFKDVIKTEPPPNLLSLIEDKEKLLAQGGTGYNAGSDRVDPEFDKEIISITTDSTYNFTSEYKDANDVAFSNPNITKDSYENIAPTSTEVITNYNATSTQVPEISQKNVTMTPSSGENGFDFGAGLENIFDLLFKDNEKNLSEVTVPPFKTLPPDGTKYELVNTFSPSSTPSSSDVNNSVEDLSVFKDVLISNYQPKDNEDYKIPLKDKMTTTTKKPDNIDPNEMSAFLSEPFNKLPFVNPSFPVKPQDINEVHKNYHYNPLTADLDLMLPQEDLETRSNFNVEGYKVLSNDPIISQTDSYVINPVDIIKLKQQQSESVAQVLTKPVTTNSIRDPAGILKLAGCNIYGRMYRVGRIISELSGPCLECKCTEIGVNCTPLNC